MTLLLTLLSGLGGGILRLLPEILAWMNKRTDNKHELEMMDKQIELQKQKGLDDRATLAAQGDQDRQTMGVKADAEQILAMLDLHKSALDKQMQLTGNPKIDAFNMLVRPITTYYFLAFYGLVKVAMIFVALGGAGDIGAWKAIVSVWGAEDAAMLWGILNFWFVGRVFDKRK